MSRLMTLKGRLILSYVPRWTVVPMMRSQTVTDHSWRVAVIADDLACRLGVSLSMRDTMIRYSVYHDIGEVETGDIPSTAKGGRVDASSLSIESLIVKIADAIETCTWARTWAHPGQVVPIITREGSLIEYLAGDLESRIPGGRKAVIDIVDEIGGMP